MISFAMRHTSRGLAAVLLGLAGLASAACDPAAQPVIGLTSSSAYLDAARLAFESGADGLPIDTVFLSEGSNRAAPALGAAEELVTIPGIAAVVGHSNSSASLAASQIYNEHQVVQIAPTASATVYSEAGPFSFRLVPPDDRQGEFLAGVLRDSLPDDAVLALLYVNDDYGRGLRSSLLRALPDGSPPFSIGLDLPHTDELMDDAGMQRHIATSLAASGPDAILWLGRASGLHVLLPTIREQLGAIPVYGGDALASAAHMRSEDRRWEGVRYVAFVDVEATDEGRRFASRFQERFGLPSAGPEALTYDAAGLLLAAVREGARTGPEIREYLLSLGRDRPAYAGVTGPIRFDERGDVERSYSIAVIGDRR